MADSSRDIGSTLDTGDDTGAVPDRGWTRTPRWVKVSGIVAAVLVLLFVVMMFTGGGGHGPGRHTQPGDAPSPGVTESSGVGAHTPPSGGH